MALSCAPIVNAAAAAAPIIGLNYASNYTNGTFYEQADFQRQFAAAQNLPGTNGMFTSARLYSSIQAQSGSNVTSAFPAAIETKTRLLLGLWASAGKDYISNEIHAIQTAIKQYGSNFTDLVDGISVGSEDLYRLTPTSLKFDPSAVGASPDEIVSYIQQVRTALKDTALSKAPIGHVDTWTAWINGSNSAVVDACDWIGTDIYPYYQSAQDNSIAGAKSVFDTSWQQNKDAVKGKPLWLTETSWPSEGDTEGKAVPSVENAARYWKDVACGELFGKVSVYWFTYFSDGHMPNFGLVNELGGAPKFDLSCDSKATYNSSGSPSPSGTGSGAGSSMPTGSVGTNSTSPSRPSAPAPSGSGSGPPAGAASARHVSLASLAAGLVAALLVLSM